MAAKLRARGANRSFSILSTYFGVICAFVIFTEQKTDALGGVCQHRPDLRFPFLKVVAVRREARCQSEFERANFPNRSSTCPKSSENPTCCISSDCNFGNVCDCLAGCERPVCLFRLDSGARSHLCPPLQPPENGRISAGIVPYTATISCNDGFFLQGSPIQRPTLTCGKNNDWLWPAERLHCQPIICHAPRLPVNISAVSAMKTHYRNGETVRIQCNEGFVFRIGKTTAERWSPTRLLRCRKSGQWMPRRLRCQPESVIQCLPPAITQNTEVLRGDTSSAFLRGSSLKIGCLDDPKRLHRPVLITCNKTGLWSGVLPNCSAPSKPRKPRRVGTTGTTITLRWRPPLAGHRSVTKYRLRYFKRVGDGETSQKRVMALMRNVGSLIVNKGWYVTTVGGLQPNVTYCIFIKAISGKFAGPDSKQLCAKTI